MNSDFLFLALLIKEGLKQTVHIAMNTHCYIDLNF